MNWCRAETWKHLELLYSVRVSCFFPSATSSSSKFPICLCVCLCVMKKFWICAARRKPTAQTPATLVDAPGIYSRSSFITATEQTLWADEDLDMQLKNLQKGSYLTLNTSFNHQKYLYNTKNLANDSVWCNGSLIHKTTANYQTEIQCAKQQWKICCVAKVNSRSPLNQLGFKFANFPSSSCHPNLISNVCPASLSSRLSLMNF